MITCFSIGFKETIYASLIVSRQGIKIQEHDHTHKFCLNMRNRLETSFIKVVKQKLGKR